MARSVESTVDAVTAINSAIEAAVRNVPAQYLWSYQWFRARPPGLPELYRVRQHPVRVFAESVAIRLWLAATGRLSLRLIRQIGALAGDLLRLARTGYVRNVQANLQLSRAFLGQADLVSLERDCLRELGKTGLEAAKIWQADADDLAAMINVSGLEYLYDGAAVVLTPALGNREVIMRILGERYRVTEYYRSGANNALDEAIRRARAARGIRLVPHSNEGVEALLERLARDEVVTICPDQQPRPDSGEIIPFLGVYAFTSTVVSRLVRESNASLLISAAIRDGRGFQVMFAPCEVDRSASTQTMLREMNQSLERAVLAYPSQYRWSEQRANIGLSGARGVGGRARA